MSLKKKMMGLLEAYPGYGKNRESDSPSQGSSKKPEVQVLEKGSGGGKTIRKSNAGLAPLGAKVGAFEEKPSKQGSSQDAPSQDLGKDPGEPAFRKAKGKAGIAMKGPVGKAPNFKTVSDPASVVNMSSSKGNVHQEETETNEELVETEVEETEVEETEEVEESELTEKKEEKEEDDDEDEDEDKEKKDKKEAFTKLKKEELERDVANLFSEEVDLTEEFKNKATALFEAAVVARVAHEMSLVEDAIAAKAIEIIAENENALIEKIDAYLTLVAEQWIADNEVAVENMLRTEIAENFMESLHTCFAENYITVPDEKYDVIGEMQEALDSLAESHEEILNDASALAEELIALKRDKVVSQVTEGMAKTQVEKFVSLIEEVTFEDEESFTDKLSIVKKNLFSGSVSAPQNVVEEVDGSEAIISEAVDPEIAALNAKITGKPRF